MIARLLLPRMLVPLGLILVGTFGYQILEGWDWFDSLYMTMITLSTIGYGETHPLSRSGRSFTMVLIVAGVFTFLYYVTEIIRSVVSGELRDLVGKHRLRKALRHMKNHVIVCGYGRMGKLVCQEFSRQGVPYVIVDEDPQVLHDYQHETSIGLVGDATNDDILRKAGIEKAHSLVTVMASDATNLFTTMSARLLNPKIHIVARVEDSHSEQKLKRAGANRVISAYQIGGSRVALAVLRPTVVDFIELATRTEHIDLQLEEMRIAANSPLAGMELRHSRVREEMKIIIVAIKKSAGHMVFNPDAEELLLVGDTLVAIGRKNQLDQLTKLANPSTDEGSGR